VQCGVAVTPKVACLLQATLLSVVTAVVVQSILNLFLDWSAPLIHLVVFFSCLPLIWWRMTNLLDGQCERLSEAEIARLEFTPNKVCGMHTNGALARPLLVRSVAHHGLAMTLTLQQADPTGTNPQRARPFNVTVWRSVVGQEKFRILSMLAHWHAWRRA
jgi:hypothetical protein